MGLIGPIRTPPRTGYSGASFREVREAMQQLTRSMSRKLVITLATGVLAVALGFVLREDQTGRYALLFLGTGLVVGGLIRHVGSPATRAPEPLRWIPIHFSGGLGRFELRSHGDGRRVEVRSGQAVVAELIATDERDELVLDFGLADDPEIDAFGVAIGLAIEMVAAADEDLPAKAEPVGSATGASSPAIVPGSLLRRLRPVQRPLAHSDNGSSG